MVVRVFVKDGLSRGHGLYSRDHLASPNHSAPQTNAFLRVFASCLHNYTILHVWFVNITMVLTVINCTDTQCQWAVIRCSMFMPHV